MNPVIDFARRKLESAWPLRLRIHHLLFVAIAYSIAALPTSALAESHYGSVMWQNDVFFGRDGGGYTNGIFFSSIRAPSADETAIEPGIGIGWVAPFLGLPRATLTSVSLSQLMMTPQDLTRRHPDPDDVPYAGILMLRSGQVFVDGNTADMAALNIGVMGPLSGAAPTQRFVHRVVGSTEPQGWSSQQSNRALFGLERARAWQFQLSQTTGGASSDVILQTGATLGNLETAAGGGFLLRYGTGLARSFGTTLSGNGSNPNPMQIGEGWFTFAGASANRTFGHRAISSDAVFRRSRLYATAGVAYGWSASSLTISLQSASPMIAEAHKAQTLGSIIYLIRFD